MHYVPIVITVAGGCLTKENWRETGCTVFSYHLDTLLHKPGYELLFKVGDLASYVSCPGTLILNASMFFSNKRGEFRLISPIDGSKVHLEYSSLLALIYNLKPDTVILPPHSLRDCPELLNSWPRTIKKYVFYEDLLTYTKIEDCGVYFTADSISEYKINDLKSIGYNDFYVCGDIELDRSRDLVRWGVSLIETDVPLKNAYAAKVYRKEGTLELNDIQRVFSFRIIEEHCSCPTCKSKLTQAYLHHLYTHTPLLAQRMIIQHNAYYAQCSLGS